MVRKSVFLKRHFKPLFYILSSLLTSLIFPIIVVMQVRFAIANDIEFAAYLMKVNLILFPLIFTGITITIFTALLFSYEPYMYGRLIFSLLPEAIYIIQIIIISSLLDVYLNIGSTFIRINISQLYLFMIGIPALILIKNIYSFYNTRKNSIFKYHILKTLYALKGESNKKKILKAFTRDTTLNSEAKMLIRKNLSNFITDLEHVKQPFLTLMEGKYKISKKGLKLILYFDNWFVKKTKTSADYDDLTLEDLEYWKEEDFD